MINSKRGGMICSYKNCKNTFYKSDVGVKFFRFPNDPRLSSAWIDACGRDDLTTIHFEKLHDTRRLCSNHFDQNMFMGPDKTHLLDEAIPRVYNDENGNSQKVEHSVSSPTFINAAEPPMKKIRILQNIIVNQPSSFECTSIPQVPLPVQTVQMQTPLSLSMGTPRKRKLQQHIAFLEEENKRLAKEVVELHQTRTPGLHEFKLLCDNFLPPKVANFVKVQASQSNLISGRRYSNDFKKFALSLYFVGPKCYRELLQNFALPSPRALQRYIYKFRFSTGINENLFSLLKLKVEKMAVPDKYCSICVDEISIKCNLFYNYGNDEVIGFEDDGMEKTLNPASSATVIIARGIKFSSTGTNAEKIKEFLHNFVKKLVTIGLKPVILITDMGANFIELSNVLGVNETNSKISLGDVELFYLFDPPHLIKAVRNNLLLHQFQWDNKSSSWHYLEIFYNEDKELKNRLAPKLTKSHIQPTNFERMRVKYATQILSATVAAGLETYVHLGSLPQDAMSTVEVIGRFDKLFDIFNSSKLFSQKMYNNAFNGQQVYIDFLDDTLKFLNSLTVIGKNGKCLSRYIKFIKAWKISIHSLLGIWNYLKAENFSFILTRRLNQDGLENFFGSIRQQGGNSVNPTPIQFSRAFKKLFLTEYFHTKFMNCGNDFDKVLTDLSNFPEEKYAELLTLRDISEPFIVDNCDYKDKNFAEQNAFKYVAGYLLKKCLQKHSCEICIKFSKDDSELDSSNLFLHFKAYNTEFSLFGGLQNPHESFYKYVFGLETVFFTNIEKFISEPGVGKNMYHLMRGVTGFTHPCDLFPIEYLIKLYIRLRIYYVLKYSNRDFKTSAKNNRKICILMNM